MDADGVEHEDGVWLLEQSTKWLAEQQYLEKREHKARTRERKKQQKARQTRQAAWQEPRRAHATRCQIRREAHQRRVVFRQEARLHFVWEQQKQVKDPDMEHVDEEEVAPPPEVVKAKGAVDNRVSDDLDAIFPLQVLPAQPGDLPALPAPLETAVQPPPNFLPPPPTSLPPPPPQSPPSSQPTLQRQDSHERHWKETINDSVQAILKGGVTQRRKQLFALDAPGWKKILESRGWELPDFRQKLGEGSYGSVERIRSRSTFELYALKRQFLGDFAEDSVAVLREISILNVLKGAKNIVQIEDAFLARPSQRQLAAEVWIVMEHFPHNLFNVQTHFYAEAHVRKAMFALLQGVHTLHRADIIHRDLKPENILVDLGENFPETLRLSICDFGMSRSIRNVPDCAAPQTPPVGDGDLECAPPPRPCAMLREVTVRVTSCLWRAPEMWGFADASRMTKRELKSIDLFALGLIWAELFTGSSVLKSTDGRDPQKLRLFEILQKVDRPDHSDVASSTYTHEIASFVQMVLSGDKSGLTLELEKDKEWNPANFQQQSRLNLPYIGIRGWVRDHARKCFRGSFDEALACIARATRFIYRHRATADELINDEYFQELRDELVHFEAQSIDDVRAPLTDMMREQVAARKDVKNHSKSAQATDAALKSVKRVNDMVQKEVETAQRERERTSI